MFDREPSGRIDHGVQVLNAHRRLLIPGLTLSTLLAACGGGHGSTLPPIGTSNLAASSGIASTISTSAPTSAPGIVQTAFSGTSGSATSASAALRRAPLVGDTVIAFIGTGDASTVATPPSGWTAAKDARGNACRTIGATGTQAEQVYIHRVTSTESGSYVFAFSANAPYAVGLVEAQHVSSSTPIDACAGQLPPKSSSTGTVAAATLTPSAAGELPVASYAVSTSGLTDSPQAGWSGGVYNDTKTPYMTLDVESGPLTSSTAVAPSTAFGNLGGSAIVFAPSVDLLLVPDASTSAPAPSAGAGAPAVGQIAMAGTNGNATSISATLGKAPAAGSVLVAFIGTGDGSAVATPPSGWTAAKDRKGILCRANGAAGAQAEQVFIHAAAAGEGAGTYRFGFSVSTAYAIGLLEVQNVAAIAPIDACAAAQPASNTTTGSVTAAPLTPSASNDLPIVGYAPSTSGLTDTAVSGWTKNVYNMTQTPYLTLDVESGPLANGGAPVTPSTTFGNLGGSNVVFAPSVHVLFAASSTSTPSVATPAPTLAPTAAPSAAPTAMPACCTNGQDWPATFRPYSATSFFNRKISNTTNPTLFANSDSIIANDINNAPTANRYGSVRTQEWGSGYDEGHSAYYATSSDPLVTLTCTVCTGVTSGVTQIHIPAKARSGDGGDGHISVIQPDGTEIDGASVAQPSSNYTNGMTSHAYGWCNAGNFYTGPGTVGGPGGCAHGDNALLGGLIHIPELQAGSINHAMIATTICTAQTPVYPAYENTDNLCSGSGGHIPYGAHIWLDVSDATINALPAAAWEKTILHAGHNFGWYVMDTGGPGGPYAGLPVGNVPIVDDGSFTPWGALPTPPQQFAINNGWNPIQTLSGGGQSTIRYAAFDQNWDPLSSLGGWAAHLHIIAPCYAQGTC